MKMKIVILLLLSTTLSAQPKPDTIFFGLINQFRDSISVPHLQLSQKAYDLAQTILSIMDFTLQGELIMDNLNNLKTKFRRLKLFICNDQPDIVGLYYDASKPIIRKGYIVILFTMVIVRVETSSCKSGFTNVEPILDRCIFMGWIYGYTEYRDILSDADLTFGACSNIYRELTDATMSKYFIEETTTVLYSNTSK